MHITVIRPNYRDLILYRQNLSIDVKDISNSKG